MIYRYCKNCKAGDFPGTSFHPVHHASNYIHISAVAPVRWDSLSSEEKQGYIQEWFPALQCGDCGSTKIVRWVSEMAVLSFDTVVLEDHQKIIGTAQSLFAICCEIGKSPNAIKLMSFSKQQYCVDIGPRHILAYNRIVGIEPISISAKLV